jgi:hypothetical protein
MWLSEAPRQALQFQKLVWVVIDVVEVGEGLVKGDANACPVRREESMV